jgi:hypothetical protein
MKRIVLSSLVAAALAVTSVAYAGLRQTYNVNVTQGQQGAGSMGSARNSTDTTQYIGCTLFLASGSSSYLVCAAQDSAGHYASCYTFDPALQSIAHTLTSDSYINFSADASGVCTQLQITNYSFLAPKAQ